MISDSELESLVVDMESDRVERKESLAADRIREAICAFANDMPEHRQPGVVFVGVDDRGGCANLPITDQLLRTLADMRDDGNTLPIPSMTVQKKTLRGCELAVVVVSPSDSPPVRFKGRVYIRVGPRRAIASVAEERRLNERRKAKDLPFDLHVVSAASLADLNLTRFDAEYLPTAVAAEVLEANERTREQQLASLRFVEVDPPHRPTVMGLLVAGKSPADYVPGAFIQVLRLDGADLTAPIIDRHEIHGPMPDLLLRLDDVLRANIRVPTDIESAATETKRPDYPLAALQQLTRNAVMHRDYETSNAPVRVNWFADRIEIQNPGGPYGQVTVENFGTPGITDYRNPHLAEALRNLGFVQRFGVGIALARKSLAENGNPPLQFDCQPNHVLAIVERRP
jgi:ATP-dependent DNA helicase RecG